MIKGQKKGDNKTFRKSCDDFWLSETSLEVDLNVFVRLATSGKNPVTEKWFWLAGEQGMEMEECYDGYSVGFTQRRILLRGLSWCSSGKESACQCRGHGFNPWSRKIPHAVGQLSPSNTNTEPTHQLPAP